MARTGGHRKRRGSNDPVPWSYEDIVIWTNPLPLSIADVSLSGSQAVGTIKCTLTLRLCLNVWITLTLIGLQCIQMVKERLTFFPMEYMETVMMFSTKLKTQFSISVYTWWWCWHFFGVSVSFRLAQNQASLKTWSLQTMQVFLFYFHYIGLSGSLAGLSPTCFVIVEEQEKRAIPVCHPRHGAKTSPTHPTYCRS